MTAAALSALLATTACGAGQSGCARADVICVGLVTGYGSVDAGIEQQAWLALQDAEAQREVDSVDFIETIDTRDRAANIAYFSEAGYDIIVTTSAGIVEETVAAAMEDPDALYISIQPGHELAESPGNLVKLEFHEEQAGFLAGAAAALVTSTDRVAAVCEARFIDYVERYCEGFAAGAGYVNQDVLVSVMYRAGSDELLFRDSDWGKEAAARAVQEGADVVFAVGESTAKSALQEAARQGALVVGAQTDAFDDQPEIRDNLLTSGIVQVRAGLFALIGQHLKEQLAAGRHWGDVGLAQFHGYEERSSPGVADQLNTLQGALNDGLLDVGLDFEP